MTLDLAVLGSAGTHTGTRRACSGYLVRGGGSTLLLDAGNGSTANLQGYLPLRDLDAVVVSHRHVDHCVDLVGCFYNLQSDPQFARRMPLYAAGEVEGFLAGLVSSDSPLRLADVFDHTEVAHGDGFQLGPLQVTFARANHPPPSVSTRVELDGASLVYSGDTAGGPELVELARGADLLLCESTWAGEEADHPPALHLTAAGAGRAAAEADVGRLVLTHIAGATSRERVLEEATAVFDGPVELAEDLVSYVVGT